MKRKHIEEPQRHKLEAIGVFGAAHVATSDRRITAVLPPGSSQTSGKTASKVLWVTNLAAPYRLPVWRYLAKRHALTVALLESNAGLQHDPSANRGHDWLHGSSDEFEFKELPSWKYSRGEARYYFLRSLRSVLGARQFDVVLFGGWESPAYWSLLTSSILSRQARIGFYESPTNTMTYRSGIVAWIRSSFFRAMDFVVVPGQAAAQAVTEMGVQPSRILQGFNAVDVAEFHRAALAAMRADPIEAPSGHRYLYAGRLIPLKRVDSIIRAFVQMAEPEDELTVVGAGPLREELSALADQRVRFLDHISNSQMPGMMATHHTLVLASEREVWGLVVNEALASGMHVVVTDNCGVVPSVKDMRGVHTAREDLADLAQQMQASKTGWTGRIAEPEVLQYTPERFASVFDSAFSASAESKRRRMDQT